MTRHCSHTNRYKGSLRLGAQTVVAYPTESCFGLGCDPWSRIAVRRILMLKARPQSKGLILIAATAEQLRPFVDWQALVSVIETGVWRDAVTIVLPASRRCPVWLRGRHQGIAVRLTHFPPARSLCQHFRSALVSTSANLSGKRALRSTREVHRVFGKRVTVIRGKIGKSKRPSQIRVWGSAQIIRS